MPPVSGGMINETKPQREIILTETQAEARTKTWDLMSANGVALLWSPWAVDRALNAYATEAVSIEDIAALADENGDGDPARLLGLFGTPLEDTPFWAAFLRPVAVRSVAPFIGSNPHVVEVATEILWEEACHAVSAYVPVGTCAGGLRPFYFHYFLRSCLRGAGRKIRARIDEVKGACDLESLEAGRSLRGLGAGPTDGTGMAEANECATTLFEALAAIRQLPHMGRAYHLLIEQGLTLRDAAVASGVSKSSLQRDSEALATHLQHHFANIHGEAPSGGVDARRVLAAVRDVLIKRGMVQCLPVPLARTQGIIPFPMGRPECPDWIA